MLVSGLSIGSFVTFRAPPATARPSAPIAPAQSGRDWEAVGQARRETQQALRALGALESVLAGTLRNARGALTVSSTSALGLDPSPATATTLASSEELNTTPTSFSPFGPSWSGASTAAPTVGGVYDGSNGTDTLTFEVKRGGDVGADNLTVEIFDSGGSNIDAVNISKHDPPGTEYTLANGLTLSLASGGLAKKDTFTVQVWDAVGSTADPDKPFDGVRNDNPNLQPGLSVGTGSFTVNGVQIDVLASDSINSVLARIDASAADVSASFDADADRVLLARKTPGSSHDIVLGADSSGFVAAAKLAAAAPVPGNDHEPALPMSSLAAFASVSSGTFSINGIDIALDVTSDSLLDVLARINASAADVTATLDAGAQRVSIVSNRSNRDLELDSGGTGLFPALHIIDGLHRAPSGRDVYSKRRSYAAADALEDVARALGRLTDATLASRVPELDRLRAGISGILNAAVEAHGDASLRGAGLRFDTDGARTPIRVDSAQRRVFTRQLQRDPWLARDLLLGDSGHGLVHQLRAALESAATFDSASTPAIGALIDRFV